MANPRILIVVPTYNERDNLPILVDAVFAEQRDADILVVDDASPDGTGKIADDMAGRDKRVHVLHRAGKRGLGSAYVEGFKWGLAQGFDVFVEMDADMSHDPRYLPALIGALEDGADLAVGSRNVPEGGVEGWGIGRQFISKGGSIYSRAILGVDVHDLTTGFKAYKRSTVLAIDLDRVHSNGYAFQIETTFRALRKGLRVVEIPIVFIDRRVGQSKMSRRIFLEAIRIPFRLRVDALRNRL
jgi:dolichol-phosphate mannosyltransferase